MSVLEKTLVESGAASGRADFKPGEVKGGTLCDVFRAIGELCTETSSQLVRVGRRLNHLEQKVVSQASQEEAEGIHRSSSVSGLSDEENDVYSSTDAYGFGKIDLSRRKKNKKKVTASPLANSNGQCVVNHDNTSGFAAIQSDDLQAEFIAVKESVLRQKLPKDLKFSASFRGIKNQYKDLAKSYATSGRYVESAIKVASKIQMSKDDPDYDVSVDVNDLLVFLIAHMRNLQEEQCVLLVGGNYGLRTQQIFRTIHANPAQYTPAVIEELKTSAALAALL